jgi:hypothetical protein
MLIVSQLFSILRPEVLAGTVKYKRKGPFTNEHQRREFESQVKVIANQPKG